MEMFRADFYFLRQNWRNIIVDIISLKILLKTPKFAQINLVRFHDLPIGGHFVIGLN